MFFYVVRYTDCRSKGRVDLSVSMQTHVFALSDCSRVGSNDGRRHAEGTFHAERAEGLGTWHEHA